MMQSWTGEEWIPERADGTWRVAWQLSVDALCPPLASLLCGLWVECGSHNPIFSVTPTDLPPTPSSLENGKRALAKFHYLTALENDAGEEAALQTLAWLRARAHHKPLPALPNPTPLLALFAFNGATCLARPDEWQRLITFNSAGDELLRYFRLYESAPTP